MHSALLRRTATALTALVLIAGLAITAQLASPPAAAATKHAGIPDLTPYGGYLGNYLAPDGSRVYCIDSPLPWPSGTTSAPQLVTSVATTWGSALPAASLRKLNYVLLKHGQTDDPVRAAAVAAYVNAFTSGWARDLGAGYAAGAWYLNGHAGVTGVYDTIWADAEANAIPVGTASVVVDAAASTVSVTASPSHATGTLTLTLTGAVQADTGETSFAVVPGEVVPIRGTPGDEAREYAISAKAAFTATTAAGPSLVLYTTPDQQRTIRGGNPGSLEFGAEAQSEPIPLDFSPVITTAVEAVSVSVGLPLVDLVTVGLAEGSRPWRTLSDGTPVALVADGVLYGPFEEQPEQSAAVPSGAPIASTEALTLTGAGEYRTSGSSAAAEPGFYTWVWSIDAGGQDAVAAASLPVDYLFASPFGLPEETHHVTSPPARLAKTGSEPSQAGLVGAALIGVGAVLGISARSRRWA